ncbi:MAG: DUF262 domain-containing protein, partial [Chitinophagaceae bacterium]|nr:DUF262 domain-containing protein [Chitinophagaceae bacterium]
MERERSSLIETIVSKLPFPEIYIHHQVEVRSGIVKHVVVDGQQRVTSILMFIENQFPLPTNDDWHGEYFRDLTEEQSEQFWNYNLVVRDLNETTDAEIRQLFVRLNTNNFALNDQELRNSRFKGAFINSVTRLADNPLFQEIGLFTPRDIRRMNDVEFVSELILLNIEGITNKKDMLDDVYLANEIEFPGEALYEKEFSSALSILRSIISPENANLFRSKTS